MSGSLREFGGVSILDFFGCMPRWFVFSKCGGRNILTQFAQRLANAIIERAQVAPEPFYIRLHKTLMTLDSVECLLVVR